MDCPTPATKNHLDAAARDPAGRFVRVYDAAHLAKHPDQLVKEMNLSITRSSGHYSHNFFLRVTLRGKNETLTTEGYCQKEGSSLRCQVECDGGGVRVEPRGDHVMVYLERITMTTVCGGNTIEDQGEEVSGGKDDRVFRLDRSRR